MQLPFGDLKILKKKYENLKILLYNSSQRPFMGTSHNKYTNSFGLTTNNTLFITSSDPGFIDKFNDCLSKPEELRYTEKNVLRLRSMSPFCTSRL